MKVLFFNLTSNPIDEDGVVSYNVIFFYFCAYFWRMKISIIVAKAQNHVIGKANQLLWHLPKDFQYFKKVTSGHYILMGRKTYESIGRPLPNRVSLVVSRNPMYALEGGLVVHSIENALEIAQKNQEKELFVIGGGKIYAQMLSQADRLYVTEVQTDIQGDTFFPPISEIWKEISRERHFADARHPFDFDFVVYEK